jgi:hypothetical protein
MEPSALQIEHLGGAIVCGLANVYGERGVFPRSHKRFCNQPGDEPK